MPLWFAANTGLVCLHGAAFWWCISHMLGDAQRAKGQSSTVLAKVYLSRRLQLQNTKVLRATQLCCGIFYATGITYGHLVLSPSLLTSAHVFGLLLAYLYVASNCWCLTLELVPYFEKLLLQFMPVVTTFMVAIIGLYINFSVYLGVAVHSNFYDKLLVYVLLWLLEDCPLHAYLPSHATTVLLHVVAHLRYGTNRQPLPMLMGYAGLGILAPVLLSGLLLPSSSHARVPSGLHLLVSVSVVVYTMTDMLLRAPLLVEPLQNAAAAGNSSAALFALLLARPEAGRKYGYGLAEGGLSLLWALLILLLVGMFVNMLSSEADEAASLDHRKLLAAGGKKSTISALLALLRGLPTAKKYAVVTMLLISALQGVGIFTIVANLLLHGPESFVRTAPLVLLCVMLGVVFQVTGALYVLVPGTTNAHAVSSAASDGRPPGWRAARTGGSSSGTSQLGMAHTTTVPGSMFSTEGAMTATTSHSLMAGGFPGMPGGDAANAHGRSLLTRANVAAQEQILQMSSGRASMAAVGAGGVGGSVAGAGAGGVGLPPAGSVHGSMLTGDVHAMAAPLSSIVGDTLVSTPNTETFSMLSGLTRGPSERAASQLGSTMTGTALEDVLDLRNRIEALANFKTFMQGLDQQPGVYSLEEFIRGAASAIKGIFPGVAHASFCLLNSTRNCVNMYTFLGDGSRKPPRINVAVAPGTLIYHVLHNCQPVFISNVAAFPGPYSDVQFMRFVLNLKSMACLPLVVAGSRILGVLRLGFEDLWNWSEQEKSIAKQLALVLSSTSSGLGGSGGSALAPQDAVDRAVADYAAAASRVMAAGGGGSGPNAGAGLHGQSGSTLSAHDALLSSMGSTGGGGGPSGSHYVMPGGGVVSGGGGGGGSGAQGGPGALSALQLRHSSLGSAAAASAAGLGPGAYGASGGTSMLQPSGSESHVGLGSHSRMRQPSWTVRSGGVGGGGGGGGNAGAQVSALFPGSSADRSYGHDSPFSQEELLLLQQAQQHFMTVAAASYGGQQQAAQQQQQPQHQQPGLQPWQQQQVLLQPELPQFPSTGLTTQQQVQLQLQQQQQYFYGRYDRQMQGGAQGVPRDVPPGGTGHMSGGGLSTATTVAAGSSHHHAGGHAGDGSATSTTTSAAIAQAAQEAAAAAHQRLQSAGADLKMMEVIGRGGFGSVYKAFWRGMVVAVKVLEHEDEFVPCYGNEGAPKKLDTSCRRAALLEGAMTSTISHPHVVQTFDYRVVHLDPQPAGPHGLVVSRVLHETQIIMEFCDRGSLQDAIEQGVFFIEGPRGVRGVNTEPEIDMELIIMTLAEVSSAMEYLHANRITHRDLKPKNILLKSSAKDRRGFTAKVSDFGLSQVLPETNKTQVSTKYSGTVTHMAPELIEDGKVYQQGDVYAFGIIMWEVFTSATPYASMAHPQIMVGVVTHNLRPKFPDYCPEWYKSLAYKCWRKDAKARPAFTEVSNALLAMLPDRAWRPDPVPPGAAAGS